MDGDGCVVSCLSPPIQTQTHTHPHSHRARRQHQVSERVAEIYTDQAMTDIALLLERMREYLRYIDSAKAALDRRTQAFGDWVSAKNTLAKKTANYEKVLPHADGHRKKGGGGVRCSAG